MRFGTFEEFFSIFVKRRVQKQAKQNNRIMVLKIRLIFARQLGKRLEI